MFAVAGQNGHDKIDSDLSLSYDWSNAGNVIMPKPRQELTN